MTVTLLRHRDLLATPWKNGGGITREIASWPPGAGFHTFDWRISLATVAGAGPFSPFPGIDRVLTVVEGELEMTIGDAPPRSLDAHALPVRFRGETTVTAAALNGSATDFNVMTRRGRIAADVERRQGPGPIAFDTADWIVILSCGVGSLTVDGNVVPLNRFDTVLAQAAVRRPSVILPFDAHIILAILQFL